MSPFYLGLTIGIFLGSVIAVFFLGILDMSRERLQVKRESKTKKVLDFTAKISDSK